LLACGAVAQAQYSSSRSSSSRSSSSRSSSSRDSSRRSSSRGGSTASSQRGGYGPAATGTATFRIDPDTGSLIVVADDETNEYVRSILKGMDRPVPQALIKVLFLEVTHTKGDDVGVEAALSFDRHSQTDEEGNVTQAFQDSMSTVFGLSNQTQGAFYKIVEDDLEITLRALASVGNLEVLSRPSILVRNNEQAIITLGQEVPFIQNSRVTADGQIINTVTYEDIGIILQVTPRITATGLVEMDVAPEISTLSGETVAISDTYDAPVIAKRAAETRVVVPDGRTVVIGGLMQDSKTETVRKVPILGDIPVLGFFFRRKIEDKTKTELLIFLTPHIVRESEALTAMTRREMGATVVTPEVFPREELDRYMEGLGGSVEDRRPAKESETPETP
jgi:general secretion pathway protein D